MRPKLNIGLTVAARVSRMHLIWERARNSYFVRDVLMLSGGTGVAQLIALAVLPLLTRIYSPEDFGILTLFISITTMLSVFTSFNFELMIMLSRTHRSASQLIWLILTLSSAVAVVITLIAVFFRHRISEFLGAPQLADWLFALPALMVCTSSYQALRYWKMRLSQFAVVSRSMVARSLTFAVSAPLFGFIPFAPRQGCALLMAFILSEFVKTAVLVKNLRYRELSPANRTRMGAVGRRHGPMALTTALSTWMGLVYDRVPDFMISSFFGASTLGLYGMVERIVAAPSRLVSKAIGDVYRQRASVLHRSQGQFDRLTLNTIAVTALISSAPFLLGIVYAPKLTSLLLGAQWEVAGHYASILMVGEFFAFVMTPIDDAALIVGAKRFIFLWALGRLLLTFSLFPLLKSGILDFTGLLWGIVTIRIFMVSIYGAAAIQYARTGQPTLRNPNSTRQSTVANVSLTSNSSAS